jgi:hypothetical protein
LEDHIGVFVTASMNKSLVYIPERDMTLTELDNYLRYGKGIEWEVFILKSDETRRRLFEQAPRPFSSSTHSALHTSPARR